MIKNLLDNVIFLSYIDNGEFFRKPLRWLYMVLAVFSLFVPFWLLYKAIYKAIDIGIFEYGGAKSIFFFFFSWLFFLSAFLIGALIWRNRKEKVLEKFIEGSHFFAIPAFSHFMQTFGEYCGTVIAVTGAGFSLSSTVFFVFFENGTIDIPTLNFLLTLSSLLVRSLLVLGLPVNPVNMGIVGILVFPIIGYLVILFSRFFAEQIRVLAEIAINTKKK